jgi:hypothetical protein
MDAWRCWSILDPAFEMGTMPGLLNGKPLVVWMLFGKLDTPLKWMLGESLVT